MTGRDAPIVVFGDDWGRHVSSMQHVFRQILGRRPVVWVNGIGHRAPGLNATDFKRAIDKGKRLLRPVRGPVPERGPEPEGPRPDAVIEPRVLPWHNSAPVYAFNVWSLERHIRQHLAALGLHEPPVIVTGSPPSVGVLGRLGERASVYFCMDDFLHLPGVQADMIGPLEERLLARVDAVVATAESLTRSKMPASGRTLYLPQGVNYDHFATPQPEPADLAGLPRPIIGFAGGVSACCDLAMVRQLAEAFPQGSIVLVGPVSVDTATLGLPNVHLLGPRPYRDLPAYVQRFDVGIIPYLFNEWTLAVDPLKLLEYLAAGIPVVTTDIPEVLKYRDVVRVVSGAGAMVAAVRAALADDAAQRRKGQATARQNTWSVRADRLLALLDEIAEMRGPRPLVPGTAA